MGLRLLLAIVASVPAPLAAEPPVLSGETLRRYPARGANQGVAVDAARFYTIDNRAIVAFDRKSGSEIAQWSGDPAQFTHLNSCIVARRDLICAHSNYPAVPMKSSVEVFDTRTLKHKRSRNLGGDIGSLTWIVPRGGAWWAAFANYDGRGGVAGRDHRDTMLVRYDAAFRERERWRFPSSVLARFAPRSSSGGTWGNDGLLYVTGHDALEVYVLAVSTTRPTLVHRATIAVDTPGQAIAWDGGGRRELWSIDRARSEVAVTRLPVVKP